MNCLNCNELLKPKYNKFCTEGCAKEYDKAKIRLKRECNNCGKIEFVSNYTQLKRQCRSCSKLGNTSSKGMSQEARDKISEAKKGHIPWNKGKSGVYSEETKISMGIKNRGKKHTIEHKNQISKGLKEYYKGKEGPNKNKVMSIDQKQKISKSLKKSRNQRISFNLEKTKDYCKSIGLEFISKSTSDDMVGKQEWIYIKCGCGQDYRTKINYLESGNQRTCKSCSSKTTTPEKEIYEFLTKDCNISSEMIKSNGRYQFLDGKELDFYIPSKGIAIEFHGLAHHSERPVFYEKNIFTIKTQHEFKYLKCKANNIQLIQIFEDEWANKRDIIKSMIRNRLGKGTKIFARKTQLKELNKQEKKEFFDKNHIDGDTHSIISWGLYHQDKLVSAISLRKTWNKKYGNVIEIARFASELNIQVFAGFSKLLKQAEKWAIENRYEGILTYADCRFGSGKVYKKVGFEHREKTKPNYYYEKNGIRENRFKHRKNKDLDGNTEREQQNKLGWYAIYDAGNNIYLKTI